MINLDHYEKLARQYGSPNCWTGTTGTLAAAILELVTEIREMKTRSNLEPIHSAFALIERIALGWSSELCKLAIIKKLDRQAAIRWKQNIDGAQLAFSTIGEDAKALVAEQLSNWLDSITDAKECSNESAESA